MREDVQKKSLGHERRNMKILSEGNGKYLVTMSFEELQQNGIDESDIFTFSERFRKFLSSIVMRLEHKPDGPFKCEVRSGKGKIFFRISFKEAPLTGKNEDAGKNTPDSEDASDITAFSFPTMNDVIEACRHVGENRPKESMVIFNEKTCLYYIVCTDKSSGVLPAWAVIFTEFDGKEEKGTPHLMEHSDGMLFVFTVHFQEK